MKKIDLKEHLSVVAESLGADIVKTKFPVVIKQKYRQEYESMLTKHDVKDTKKYLEFQPKSPDKSLTREEHTYRMKLLVNAAPRTYVIVSGGPEIKDNREKELSETTRIVIDDGAEGRIIGRNFWGVSLEKGLKLADTVVKIMTENQYHRKLFLLFLIID